MKRIRGVCPPQLTEQEPIAFHQGGSSSLTRSKMQNPSTPIRLIPGAGLAVVAKQCDELQAQPGRITEDGIDHDVTVLSAPWFIGIPEGNSCASELRTALMLLSKPALIWTVYRSPKPWHFTRYVVTRDDIETKLGGMQMFRTYTSLPPEAFCYSYLRKVAAVAIEIEMYEGSSMPASSGSACVEWLLLGVVDSYLYA